MAEDEFEEISAEELVNNLKKIDSQMKVLGNMRDQVGKRLEGIARGIENINLASSQRDTKIAELESRIRRAEERAKELELKETEGSISRMNMDMVMNRVKVMEKEVEESKKRGKGILGIRLKGTNGPIPASIPTNAVGDWQPDKFAGWIEWAYQNRAKG